MEPSYRGYRGAQANTEQTAELNGSYSRPRPTNGYGSHVTSRSDHLSSLEKDKEAWRAKHQAMRDQLSSLQEECRKLQVKTLPPRPRTDSDASSSASLPAYIPRRHLTDTRRPLIGSVRLGDSNSSISSAHSGHSVNRRHYYTSTPHNKPRVHVSLNGMDTSPTDLRTNYLSPESTNASSTRVSPEATPHQATTRIKQLEKEVSLLEGQLSDKTQSARNHVEELTKLRVELAQERASLDIIKQEIRDNSRAELERARKSHERQCREYQDQLDHMTKHQEALKNELGSSRKALKGSQSEVTLLTQRLASLHTTLDEQQTSHEQAMAAVRSEVKTGSEKVAQLEQALEDYRQELEGHVTTVQANSTSHMMQREQLQTQVEALSNELADCRSSLLAKTQLAIELQTQLTEAHTQEGDLMAQLADSEAENQSLKDSFDQLQDSLSKARAEITAITNSQTRAQHQVTQTQASLDQTQAQLKGEVAKTAAAESEIARLTDKLSRLDKEFANHKQGLEEKAGLREKQVEDMLSHMQSELTKRAQQVMSMDGLLRSHQAETASKRLQLERALASRQAELRTRTSELEDVVIQLSQAKSREEGLRLELQALRNHMTQTTPSSKH